MVRKDWDLKDELRRKREEQQDEKEWQDFYKLVFGGYIPKKDMNPIKLKGDEE